MVDWLTVDDIAARLKVHPETVRRWLRSGKLDGIWLSDSAGWRVSEDDYAAFLTRQREASKSVA